MGFRHQALFYRGDDDFVDAVAPHLHGSLDSGGAALVAVDPRRGALLREALGARADRVDFANMRELGANPARIIPVWRDFVDEHASSGRPLVGIGEPVWPGRDEQELVECHRHECLLNRAFADGPSWFLGCPYDADGLDPGVLEAAHHSHSEVMSEGAVMPGHARPDAPLPGEALRPATAGAAEMRFGARDLPVLRGTVSLSARAAGLDGRRTADVLLAVNELASNSLLHGGGGGVLRTWRDATHLFFEVSDAGVITDPLIGRTRPEPEALGGRGVWLVNQLCELVQLRSGDTGTTVRVRMSALSS